MYHQILVYSQMDKEGYVPLDVIGRFNRVRALTQNVALIKEVISTKQ